MTRQTIKGLRRALRGPETERAGPESGAAAIRLVGTGLAARRGGRLVFEDISFAVGAGELLQRGLDLRTGHLDRIGRGGRAGEQRQRDAEGQVGAQSIYSVLSATPYSCAASASHTHM